MKHSVKEYKLDNGARGLVVNVPGSSVVALSAVFRSGFTFGDFNKYEVPHVMEHMMGSGSSNYPTAVDFKTEVEKNGAYRNASTSPYFNTYDYEFASFETKRIVELLGEQIAKPLFPAASFPTEVSNVHEELSRNTSNYDRLCAVTLGAAMNPTRVMEDDKRIMQLPSITRDDVISFYKRTHGSKNLFFFIGGSFEDEGAGVIEQLFEASSPLPVGKRFDFDQPAEVKLDSPLLVNKPIKQLYYTLTGKTKDLTQRERLAGRLLSSMYTMGYRSWIQGESRERGLAYHTATGFNRAPGYCSLSYMAYVTPENAEELFNLFVRTHKRASAQEFNRDELEATKDLLIGRITRSHQTAGDMLGWYIGNYAFDEEILDFNKYLDDLRTITPEEVSDIAKKLGHKGNWGLSLVGDISKTQANKLYKIVSDIWS